MPTLRSGAVEENDPGVQMHCVRRSFCTRGRAVTPTCSSAPAAATARSQNAHANSLRCSNPCCLHRYEAADAHEDALSRAPRSGTDRCTALASCARQ
eukprot:4647026-Prymnesium_polylepis.2